jgi:pilus assembly protein CpaE
MPVTVAVAIAAPELWEPVQAALRGLAVRVVMEQRDLRNWLSLTERLESLRPEVVLLDITQLPLPLDDAVHAVHAVLPDCMLVALDATAQPDIIMAAMRAGANEFLYPPLGDNLRKAFERQGGFHPQPRENNRAPGKVVGFLSAKGGSGASTIACHVAAELGRVSALRAERGLLADLDLESGIVGFLMKVKSPYTILDAVRNLHRLDASYWNALVSAGWPGLELIAAPSSYSQDSVSGESLRKVLAFARAHYLWTIADLGCTLSPARFPVLEEIDDIYLVTTLEVPSLHLAKLAVRTLTDAGLGSRLHMVLNRTPQRPDVPPGELERILGLPIDTMLPNDYYALYDASCKGKLLPPASRLSRELARFAVRLVDIPVAHAALEKGKRRFGLFG